MLRRLSIASAYGTAPQGPYIPPSPSVLVKVGTVIPDDDNPDFWISQGTYYGKYRLEPYSGASGGYALTPSNPAAESDLEFSNDAFYTGGDCVVLNMSELVTYQGGKGGKILANSTRVVGRIMGPTQLAAGPLVGQTIPLIFINYPCGSCVGRFPTSPDPDTATLGDVLRSLREVGGYLYVLMESLYYAGIIPHPFGGGAALDNDGWLLPDGNCNPPDLVGSGSGSSGSGSSGSGSSGSGSSSSGSGSSGSGSSGSGSSGSGSSGSGSSGSGSSGSGSGSSGSGSSGSGSSGSGSSGSGSGSSGSGSSGSGSSGSGGSGSGSGSSGSGSSGSGSSSSGSGSGTVIWPLALCGTSGSGTVTINAGNDLSTLTVGHVYYITGMGITEGCYTLGSSIPDDGSGVSIDVAGDDSADCTTCQGVCRCYQLGASATFTPVYGGVGHLFMDQEAQAATGTWTVNISVSGTPISGSPFTVSTTSGSGIGAVIAGTTYTVTATGTMTLGAAGSSMGIDVPPDGAGVPPYIGLGAGESFTEYDAGGTPTGNTGQMNGDTTTTWDGSSFHSSGTGQYDGFHNVGYTRLDNTLTSTGSILGPGFADTIPLGTTGAVTIDASGNRTLTWGTGQVWKLTNPIRYCPDGTTASLVAQVCGT